MSYDAGKWMRDMALLQISPDTRYLADQLRPGGRHQEGCLYPECAEVRAAVDKGMYEHAEHLARLQAGKRAAAAGIIAQRRREAAARAEVARELAYWGAYPYRVSGKQLKGPEHGVVQPHMCVRDEFASCAGCSTTDEAVIMHLQRLEGPWQYKPQAGDPHAPCTCRDPKPGTSGVEDRPYAHDRGCRRNHGQFSGTPGWRTEHGEITAGQARISGTGTITVTVTVTDPLTPEQEIRAELEAFDEAMLRGPQYPAWMEHGSTLAEPGRCRECRWGYPAAAGGLCLYCKLRIAAVREAPRNQELRTGNRDHSGWAVMAVVAVMMAAAAVLYSQPVVLVPVLALGLLALLRRLP